MRVKPNPHFKNWSSSTTSLTRRGLCGLFLGGLTTGLGLVTAAFGGLNLGRAAGRLETGKAMDAMNRGIAEKHQESVDWFLDEEDTFDNCFK